MSTSNIGRWFATLVCGALISCTSSEPLKTGQIEEEVRICDVVSSCSSTGETFFGSGSPGEAMEEALEKCHADCVGGTCRVASRRCCDTNTQMCF